FSAVLLVRTPTRDTGCRVAQPGTTSNATVSRRSSPVNGSTPCHTYAGKSTMLPGDGGTKRSAAHGIDVRSPGCPKRSHPGGGARAVAVLPPPDPIVAGSAI